jgi:ABC-type cobalamin/Fe3+-siderophores transport system ATPase subunit
MTANEIIEEIKRLNLQEQLGVIRFAHQLDAERRLTGKELAELAERMVNATDRTEEAIIREAMIRGFYSATAGRAGSGTRNKRTIAKRNRNKVAPKRM